MSDFDKCERCGDYGWLNSHTCPPAFMVKLKDDEDEAARQVYASDADRAAVRFCERYDSDFDHQIIEHREADLEVWPVADESARQSIHIRAEMVPDYWVD